MQRLVPFVVGAIGLAAAWAQESHAQTAARANWLTDGGDAQRTSWQRHETLISPASVNALTLLWKVKLDNQQREMHNLFAPLVIGDLQVASGVREIAVVAGISDNLYGIDVERGVQIWKRHFDSTFDDNGRSGGPLCPGGQTATPIAVPTQIPGKYVVYAISWDGRLRTVDPSTGQEIARAEPFLPPNGKPYALNIHNNVLYTTTAQGCGGTPNQFYGYDLATKKVGSFNPGSGGLWPRLGPSIGKDGTVYAGSGDGDYFPDRQIFGQSIVAVKQNPETKALEMTDWYTPSNAYWLRKRDLDMNATGPVFEYKGKEYTVHTSKECRVWLLDRDALGRSSATRKCSSPARASGGRSPLGSRPTARAGSSYLFGGRSIRSSQRRSNTEPWCRERSPPSRSKRRAGNCSSRRPGYHATCGRPIPS